MFRSLKVYHKRFKRRRKKKTNRRSRKEKLLRKTAARLQGEMPKSEKWFHQLYEPFRHHADRNNKVYGHYIPDVINKLFRYIIEVDGSYHARPEQQKKDLKKDAYFQTRGFKVIRIKAYDEQSFQDGIRNLVQWREYKLSASTR